MKPLLALVGHPNVGKSTLFNRLVGKRLALVEDMPGVTRDRHYADMSWEGRDLTVVDTGGFVPGGSEDVLEGVRAQAEIAVETCDIVLLLVDGRPEIFGHVVDTGGHSRHTIRLMLKIPENFREINRPLL